eukprot:gene7558-11881_t
MSSDITQQQFDREDYWEFVRPWSITVFSLYSIYTLIIIPLVIWRSNFHPLKSRSKVYLFVMIFTQYLMVSILSLRIAIGRQIFPCTLYYVFAFFGVPMFMAPYLMQSFRLIMVTRLTHLKDDMVNFEIPEELNRKQTLFSLTKPLSLFQKKEDKNNVSIFGKFAGNVAETPVPPPAVETPLPEDMEEPQSIYKKEEVGKEMEEIKDEKNETSLSNENETKVFQECSEIKQEKEPDDKKEPEEETPQVTETQIKPKIITKEEQFAETEIKTITMNNPRRKKRQSVKLTAYKMRRFKMLKLYSSSSFIISIFFLAMGFQGILFMAFNAIYYQQIFLWDQGCAFEFSAGIVVVIFTVAYIGVLAVFCLLLLFVKEEFKIRQELFLNMIIWSVFGFIWLLMALIPQWNREYEYYFSAIWSIVFACFLSNFVAIAIPIIRTFTWNKRKKKRVMDRDSMTENRKLLLYMTYDHSKIVDDANAKDFNTLSHLLAVIESSSSHYLGDYCKREWSSENFLFIEQLNLYKNLKKRSEQIYYGNLIFDTFLSKSADLELNISQRLRTAVRNRLDEAQKEPDIEELISNELFYDVESSIINLMLDTWGRFLTSDLFQKMKENLKKTEKFENPNKK